MGNKLFKRNKQLIIGDKAFSDLEIDFNKVVRLNGHSSVSVKCNLCGDVKHSHDVSSLHTAKYACKQCLINKYKSICNGIERTYLKHTPPIKEGGKTVVTTQVTSTCNKCGTTEDTSAPSLVSGSGVLCQTCLKNRYQIKAEQIGADYLAHGNKRLTFRCHAHGHIFNVAQDSSHKTKGGCEECILLDYKLMLQDKGCTLLHLKLTPASECDRTRVFYMNEGGEVFDTSLSNLRKGEFTTSLDGQWYTQHSTYLIRLQHKDIIYYKIGTAQNPFRRMKDLGLLGESSVYILDSFSDRFAADALESILHTELKNFKLNKEVASTFTTAKNSVKRKGHPTRIHVKDGISEWFTHEVYDILKTRYNLEKEQNGINSNTTGKASCSR